MNKFSKACWPLSLWFGQTINRIRVPYLSHRASSAFRCARKCWRHQTRSSPVRRARGSCCNWGWRWPQSWGSAVAWGWPHSGSRLPGRCWCLGRLWVWLLPYPCIAHSPLSIVWGRQKRGKMWFRWKSMTQEIDDTKGEKTARTTRRRKCRDLFWTLNYLDKKNDNNKRK